MRKPEHVFPAITELVPHRGAMLWLERVVAATDEFVEAAASVPAHAWYFEQGAMPAWLGIELMAQAVSAHVGLRGLLTGAPPKPGVLLGCRAYRAGVPSFAPAAALRIRARLNYRDETGFAAYDCAISLGATELASATLKVYEPPDFAAFLASTAS